MPQLRSKTRQADEKKVSAKKVKTSGKAAENAAMPARSPSEQARELVDVTFGAVPRVAGAARKGFEQWRKPDSRSQEIQLLQQRISNLRNAETRDGELEALRKRLNAEVEKAKAEGPEVRRKVTDQLVEQAKKARQRVGV